MTTKPHKKFRRPQQPETSEPETPKSSKKRADKGLFSDGRWWCNCNPRRELSLTKVKKNGNNYGKFYYRCYDGCNLFLWEDAALARETGLAPTTPSKDQAKEAAEPQQPRTPSFTQRVLTSYGYPLTPSRRQSDVDTSFNSESSVGNLGQAGGSDEDGAESEAELVSTPTRARASAPASVASGASSSKRKRDVFEEDEFSDLESDQEREMIEIGEKSAEKFEAQKRRYTTPCDARTTDIISGLPTPSVARTLFRENKRAKHVSFEESSSSVAPLSTPPPGSSQPQAASPPPSTPQADSCDVTDEVMRLLKDQSVSPSVLRSIQGVLSLSARRAKGIALGREAAKSALKAQGDKIAALEEQIVALEERERAHRNQMTNIKAGLMKMYEDN